MDLAQGQKYRASARTQAQGQKARIRAARTHIQHRRRFARRFERCACLPAPGPCAAGARAAEDLVDRDV